LFKECGVKYKTKPGLSYHVQKAHGYGKSIKHFLFVLFQLKLDVLLDW